MDSPLVNWSHHLIDDGDPEWVVKWWKANAFNHPLMAQAARDYLSVPSAEVGVERQFSGARDVLGLRRHCMNAETMRWLMLLKGATTREIVGNVTEAAEEGEIPDPNPDNDQHDFSGKGFLGLADRL